MKKTTIYAIVGSTILLLGSIGFLTLNDLPANASSANRIVKVAENNIEWTKSKLSTTTEGVVAHTWDETTKISLGEDGVTEMMIEARRKMKAAQAINCSTYKQAQIDNAQVYVDEANLLYKKLKE